MTIDEVKRNLEYTYKKHRNDSIPTFGTNISLMAMDCHNAIEKLEKEKSEAYNKAIDDLICKIEEHKTKGYITGITNNSFEFGACQMADDIVKIAKQLKQVN